MQGQCAIIKALNLKCPPDLFGPKQISFGESYFNLFGKGGSVAHSTNSIWKKDLEKSFKQTFSFANQSKTVDENDDSENETESDSEDDRLRDENEKTGQTTKERIIEAMELPYSNMPHAKGDSRYCEVDEGKDSSTGSGNQQTVMNDNTDQSQIVLEKRMELDSLTFLDLMRLKDEAGRLNKDVVYLDIASMQSGDIFDLREILMPTGRKLMLVSKGAVLLRIKRDDYLRYSTKSTMKCARDIALQADYPSDEVIYRSYNERCAWENTKRKHLSSAMEHVQSVCVRHSEGLQLEGKYTRKPLKAVRGIIRKEIEEQIRLKQVNEYLNFVYRSCQPAEKEDRLVKTDNESPIKADSEGSCKQADQDESSSNAHDSSEGST